MSLLEREARRGHIKQIMTFLNTEIRAEMQRAIEDNTAPTTSKAGHIAGRLKRMAIATSTTGNIGQPEASRNIDRENANSGDSEPARESTVTPPHDTASHDNKSSLDPSALSRIAASLRHLLSGSDIPEGTFDGSTSDDVSVLDDLCQSLSHILQEIDRNIAAALRPAAERFDNHIQSSTSSSASTTGTCRYKAQEEWQTGRGRKTQWDPDADWDSDMVWSEVEVSQPAGKRAPSRLRQTYVPCEWSIPLTELPL